MGSLSDYGRLWDAIESLREEIKELMVDGCAKRNGDVNRVEALEERADLQGKKLDRILLLLVGNLLAVIGGLIARALY